MEFSQENPSAQFLLNFDFRVESFQQLVAGKLMPGERRVKILQRRRRTLQEEVFEDSTFQTEADDRDYQQKVREAAPNTSERASPSGTASKRDIEQAPPKVGADRPDSAEPAGTTTETTESKPARTPSMSEAGAGRS